MIKLISLIPIIYLLSGCEYEDDFSFMSDARANYFSEEVLVNGLLCKDISGAPGACSIQVPNNLQLKINLEPRPYEYRFSLACSSKLGFDVNASVLKLEPKEIIIPKEKIEAIDSFTCIGEIFPQDREQAVSMKFEIRVKVYDSDLIKMDVPQLKTTSKGKTDILIGPYGKHTKVCDSISCKHVLEKFNFTVKMRQVVYIKAESASGRIAYWTANGL